MCESVKLRASAPTVRPARDGRQSLDVPITIHEAQNGPTQPTTGRAWWTSSSLTPVGNVRMACGILRSGAG